MKDYKEETDVGIANSQKKLPRPVMIGVLVALLIGGAFLASTIANSPEAKRHHKQSSEVEQTK